MSGEGGGLMQLDSRYIRFLPMTPWPGWRRVQFGRTGTSMQLQETGLIIQGRLRTLFMPLLDFLFTRILSEQATLTIPYSRIRFLYPVRHVILRIVTTTLAWIPFLIFLALFGISLWSNRTADDLWFTAYMLALTLFVGVVATLYLNFWRYVSRQYLLFEQADGKPAMLAFRIRDRKRRQEFLSRVEANRRQEAGLRFGRDE
jgi:hypothetical protein